MDLCRENLGASSPQANQPPKESQGSKCVTTTISGSGSDVIDVSDQAGCRFVTASCDGDSNFIIKAYNYQGERIKGIVNEICGEDGYRWRKMWNPGRKNEDLLAGLIQETYSNKKNRR